MSEEKEPAAIISLVEARRERLHHIHEARLAEVRAAFEKAMPLGTKPRSTKAKKPRKKKPPKR